MSLSGLGVDEILHLAIALVNFSFEKGFYKEVAKGVILLTMSLSMHQS